MVKGKFTVSIDPHLWKLAQDMGFNMSGECEHALRIRTQATKKDAPDESIELICAFCGKKVKYGYLCRQRNKFVCPKCHDDWDCKVPIDHEHIRLPAYDNKIDDRTELLNKVSLSGAME